MAAWVSHMRETNCRVLEAKAQPTGEAKGSGRLRQGLTEGLWRVRSQQMRTPPLMKREGAAGHCCPGMVDAARGHLPQAIFADRAESSRLIFSYDFLALSNLLSCGLGQLIGPPLPRLSKCAQGNFRHFPRPS